MRRPHRVFQRPSQHLQDRQCFDTDHMTGDTELKTGLKVKAREVEAGIETKWRWLVLVIEVVVGMEVVVKGNRDGGGHGSGVGGRDRDGRYGGGAKVVVIEVMCR